MALEDLPLDVGSPSIDFSQFQTPQAATDVINQYAAPVTSESVGQLYDTGGFDFSSYFPSAAQQQAVPSAATQQQNYPAATAQYAPQNLYASTDPTAGAPKQADSISPELQSLYQQANQPLPSIIGQVGGKTGYAGAQGQDLYGGLYDTTGLPTVGPAAGAAPQDKGNLLQSLLGKGFSVGDALKLALGIGGGIMGYNAQQKAASDTAAAEAEYKAAAQNAASQYQTLAQPYLTAGGSQLSMALQGSLSPAQMQAFQAAEAQLAQGAEKTGGVGAVQRSAALENIRQQALQNQQNMALQLLGPGNTLASNAIATELQGTQGGLKLGLDLATQANQASMNMYSAIASMIGGQKPSTQTATP